MKVALNKFLQINLKYGMENKLFFSNIF